MKALNSLDESMALRVAQLQRVMDRIAGGEDVPVLQLADAVQLVDEMILLHPLDYGTHTKWEVVRGYENSNRKTGLSPTLFPTMRDGLLWAARRLLAKPPRGRDNMFPLFDIVTGKVLERVKVPRPGRVNLGLKIQPPKPGGTKRRPEQTRRELIG